MFIASKLSLQQRIFLCVKESKLASYISYCCLSTGDFWAVLEVRRALLHEMPCALRPQLTAPLASVARPRQSVAGPGTSCLERPHASFVLSEMTTTWPRYREECEQPGYVSCAYTHDCGQHMIEQEGRRLGSGNGAFAGDSFPRAAHSGAPGEVAAASELLQASSSGKASGGRERQREKRHGGEERYGREEKRRDHHRSERHLRGREAIDPSPPPPPPPDQQPEQPKQAAPMLSTNTTNAVNLASSAADCVDCAAAQAQAAQSHALPNGQAGMEVIESINPGKE